MQTDDLFAFALGYNLADSLFVNNQSQPQGPQRRTFDWNNKVFQNEMDSTMEAFKASYPEIDWHAGKGRLKMHFVEKYNGIKEIDKIANEGRINELEYLALYKQILAPKVVSPEY